MPDYQEIANTIARFLAAVDERNWDGARALMTKPFHLDYSSFGGGDAADVDPADVLAAWAGLLPGFDTTHHQLGNLDIDIDGTRATAKACLTATHVIEDRVWTVVGTYDQVLTREADGWKLASLCFRFKYQSGALDLPQLAGERAAAADANA